MIPEQQIGHQKVQFETLLDAIEYREICPLCSSQLLLTCSSGSVRVYEKNPIRDSFAYDRSYNLVIRNISNTADFIRVWSDGITTEIFCDVALAGKNHLFYFPINLVCKECNDYKHSFRIGIDLKGSLGFPGVIKEILMVSIALTLSKEENMILRTYYFPESTELIINNKSYKINFLDIDVTKSKELFERYSAIVPFI